MKVSIRKFEEKDVVSKIDWINDSRNNQFLHYDIPLEVEKTKAWFWRIRGRTDRFDAVIEVDGVACGTIGLLRIDEQNRKAEYYVAMGETALKGKSVSTVASRLLLDYAFNELRLNRVYLYTEVENIPAQKLFEKVGFKKEGLLKDDLFSKGRFVSRYAYGLCKEDYVKEIKRGE